MTLLGLADRCEREEPSRALRCEIAEALGLSVDPAPRMLDSIDAAATLVPEGWHILELEDAYDDSWVSCVLYKNADSKCAAGVAPTEPRARTAAALRALAQEQNDE